MANLYCLFTLTSIRISPILPAFLDQRKNCVDRNIFPKGWEQVSFQVERTVIASKQAHLM